MNRFIHRQTVSLLRVARCFAPRVVVGGCCLFILAGGDSSLGQTNIISNTTQVGGTVNTPGSGVLSITHSSNNPRLRLQSNATRNSSAAVIGRGSGHSGRLLIESGSTLNNVGSYEMLDSLPGSGYFVYGGGAYLGADFNATGTATVRGSGSRWNIDGELVLGHRGNGTLAIQDGGHVASGVAVLGRLPSSVGTAVIDGPGSSWNSGNWLWVGQAGEGDLTIQNGGQVSGFSAHIATASGSVGTITVKGQGSTLIASDSVSVGGGGTASLTVENGGQVFSDRGFIGTSLSGAGTATITGSGSSWVSNETLSIGGSSTHAAVTVSHGGIVGSEGNAWGNGGGTVATLAGGTFAVGGTLTNNGLIEIASGGQLSVDPIGGDAIGGSGTLVNNGSIFGDVAMSNGGVLKGDGHLDGLLTLADGAVLAPGNSVGLLTGTDAVWGGGGVLDFEINDALGTFGGPEGWDGLQLSGTLDITATAADPFLINISSLDLFNDPGWAANFDPMQSYEWTFVTAAGGITGFDPSHFVLDWSGYEKQPVVGTKDNSDPSHFLLHWSGFQNDLMGGAFSIVQQDANSLAIRFAAVPEPSSLIVFGMLACGLIGLQRRRRHVTPGDVANSDS